MRAKSRTLLVPTAAQFQRASTDDEIPQRKVDAASRLLSADPSYDFRRRLGNRMDRHRGFQFVEECPPPVADLRRVGAIDAVPDLGDRERAKNNWDFARRLSYRLDGLFGSEFPALCGDQNTGVKY
jgi:hypothetical protein